MTTGRRWRAGGIWTLLAVLLLVLGAQGVLAWGKKSERKRPPRKAVLMDTMPTLAYERGILSKSIYGGWELDNTPLVFDGNSRITEKDVQGFGGSLVEGREALIMGYRRGTGFVVHRLTLMTVDESVARGTFSPVTSDREPEEASPATPQ